MLVAAEALAANTWRDIATAPKDGTPIDLWVVFPTKGTCRRWADARWMEAGEHAAKGPANWCDQHHFPLHIFKDKPVATHWRPRPLGPNGEAIG